MSESCGEVSSNSTIVCNDVNGTLASGSETENIEDGESNNRTDYIGETDTISANSSVSNDTSFVNDTTTSVIDMQDTTLGNMAAGDGTVVWVPYLGLFFLILAFVVLMVSFRQRYIRVRKRQRTHQDYLQRDIDLNRKRLHGMLRNPALNVLPIDYYKSSSPRNKPNVCPCNKYYDVVPTGNSHFPPVPGAHHLHGCVNSCCHCQCKHSVRSRQCCENQCHSRNMKREDFPCQSNDCFYCSQRFSNISCKHCHCPAHAQSSSGFQEDGSCAHGNIESYSTDVMVHQKEEASGNPSKSHMEEDIQIISEFSKQRHKIPKNKKAISNSFRKEQAMRCKCHSTNNCCIHRHVDSCSSHDNCGRNVDISSSCELHRDRNSKSSIQRTSTPKLPRQNKVVFSDPNTNGTCESYEKAATYAKRSSPKLDIAFDNSAFISDETEHNEAEIGLKQHASSSSAPSLSANVKSNNNRLSSLPVHPAPRHTSLKIDKAQENVSPKERKRDFLTLSDSAPEKETIYEADAEGRKSEAVESSTKRRDIRHNPYRHNVLITDTITELPSSDLKTESRFKRLQTEDSYYNSDEITDTQNASSPSQTKPRKKAFLSRFKKKRRLDSEGDDENENKEIFKISLSSLDNGQASDSGTSGV